ncbi:MAG: hypothetical protein A2017_20155 [Lentisphaerae bacterium GWF2_44_16]|nr:MAG: hypothetical protein A2017_20155 [Lentisphaerae bacterium GWF2_44_16]
MLAECWRELTGLEIITFHLPVMSWTENPAAKFESARLLMETVKKEKPSFILDINGAGIIPFDETHKHWTASEFSVPCVEWWWDDPNNNSALFYDIHYQAWFEALTSSAMIHFFWDAVLAEEYSVWFGKKCFFAPTAVHPGAFNPDAGKLSGRKFKGSDVSFLGSCYPSPDLSREEFRELDFLSEKRLAFPQKNYFELMKDLSGEAPLFFKTLKASLEIPSAIFSSDTHRLRNSLNTLTGIKRRKKPLAEIMEKFKSCLIVGNGYPPSFNASTDTFFQPLELSACYKASVFNLDLGNAQSFTGTNMRSYEIMSCGALLVRNEKPDFDPDASLEKHVYLRFSSAGELHELYREYSADKGKFSEICANARQYVIENHSWLNRLAAIIPVLSEKISLK